jgi:diamine N-acetyltransferase
MNPQTNSTMALQQEIVVRAATPADAAALATLGRDAFAAVHQSALPQEELHGFLADCWNQDLLATMIANPEVQLLVAEIGEQLAGLACLNPTKAPIYLRRVRPIELCRVYLQREWIGQGVGSQLMTYALRQAADKRYGVCWLRVWQGNKSAINFYKRWRFAIVAADKYAIGNTSVPLWLMVHSLSKG